MFNVGGGELLVIMLVALIVLGPTRLPDAARTLGKVVGEVRRMSSGFQNEIREAFEDAEITTTLDRPRRTEAKPLAAAVERVDAVARESERAHRRGDDADPIDGVAANGAGTTAGGGPASMAAVPGGAGAPSPGTDPGDDGDTPVIQPATPALGGAGQVAPEVAAALDEIVAPPADIAPPTGAAGATGANRATGAAGTADGDPPPGVAGDERAAS
ncbi:MAG TPA: Sec-independent protein translocase protein TatB [Acidimicrobiales bacterium]|nr:Sec-independent protein translocase protein TatB [Acidimicrobiales bacterium]